jgi:FtsH-binding integral membrane protein
MPKNISNPPVWPRRFMVLTAVIIAVVALIGFNAMSKQNFTLAFPMFASVVVLLLFLIVLMYLQNRR